MFHTLRRDSPLHCRSSSQAAIHLYNNSSKLTEMKIYNGVSCSFLRMHVPWYLLQEMFSCAQTTESPPSNGL